MVRVEVDYQGQLRCRALHIPSGTELLTDAPVDNHGKGEAHSPTDLLAAGLGTCMLTVMGIRAEKGGYSIADSTASVEKHMTTEGPRRVARLLARLSVPAGALSETQKKELVHAALNCPVKLSLHEAIDVEVEFDWL